MPSGWLNVTEPWRPGPQRHQIHRFHCLAVSDTVCRTTNLRLAKPLGGVPGHARSVGTDSNLGCRLGGKVLCPVGAKAAFSSLWLAAAQFACIVAASTLRRLGFRADSCTVIFGRDPAAGSPERPPSTEIWMISTLIVPGLLISALPCLQSLWTGGL